MTKPSSSAPLWADQMTCDHADVRYFKDEDGAVACMDCGRLFGHLVGWTFQPHNPRGSDSLCHGCEERPIRERGELVSWLEGMTERRIYCQQCADECAAGLWEGDDDREEQRA